LENAKLFKEAFEAAKLFNLNVKEGTTDSLVYAPTVEDKEEPVDPTDDPDKNHTADAEGGSEVTTEDKEGKITVEQTPFLNLSLDVPPPPLFKDDQEKNIIPQVPIYTLLDKFDGHTVTYLITGLKKKFKILSAPQYLVIHIKRFTKNNFFWEKNPTIVTFPLKNFDLKQYISITTSENTKYDLIGNICHEGEGEAQKGTYKCHVLNKGMEQWYEMQDLTVKQIMPQMIPLTESYMLIYERQAKK